MKMAKLLLILVVISGIILFSLASCDWNGDGSGSGSSTPQPGGLLADQITATYGSDQFHAQLTAIAEKQFTAGAVNP